MSGPQDTNSLSRDSSDYFSRRSTRHSLWAEDLVTIDSDGERSPALSPVQNDLLTPATLSPPIETTETSPLLDSDPYGYQYASTSAPVVCCRAGARPAEIPPNVNAHIFPDGPPQDMGGCRGYAVRVSDLERNKTPQPRRRRLRNICCDSKYLHRWLMALGLLAILILTQHLILRASTTEPSHAGDPHSSLPYCSETFSHSFDKLETFSFVDELGTHVPVEGAVWIEPAPEGQEADVFATVSYSSSKRFKLSSHNWGLTDSSIHLRLPTFTQSSGMSFKIFRSRLRVDVVLRLKADVNLSSLEIDTTHLAIRASTDIFEPPNNVPSIQPTIGTTKFTTSSSPINLAYWASRRTILKTSSSPITGAFTLLDLLVLTSQSGSIGVRVYSGEADSSSPHPAQLSVSTSSGSVRVDSGTTNVHDREYRTDVTSQSGSVTGTYLLGSAAHFTTSSGTIIADVLPYDSQRAGSLQTRSSSGATKLNVLRAYKNGDKAFANLRSEHVSNGSGSLTLRYPGEWEGKISARASSGSVSVKGRGVVVDEASKYDRHVLAHKGEGDSTIEARTGSASVDVLIGDF
jgi:hypothetical protein